MVLYMLVHSCSESNHQVNNENFLFWRIYTWYISKQNSSLYLWLSASSISVKYMFFLSFCPQFVMVYCQCEPVGGPTLHTVQVWGGGHRILTTEPITLAMGTDKYISIFTHVKVRCDTTHIKSTTSGFLPPPPHINVIWWTIFISLFCNPHANLYFWQTYSLL